MVATATVPDTPVSTRVYDSHRRRSVPHRAPSDDAVPALLHGERAAEGAQEDVRLHRRRLLAQYRQLALGELVDARHRAERVCALPPPRAGQCDAARDMRDERRVGYLPGEEREREAALNGFRVEHIHERGAHDTPSAYIHQYPHSHLSFSPMLTIQPRAVLRGEAPSLAVQPRATRLSSTRRPVRYVHVVAATTRVDHTPQRTYPRWREGT